LQLLSPGSESMLVPSLPTPRVLMLKVIPYGFTWEWRRSPPGLTHTEDPPDPVSEDIRQEEP
jgi:hypothetical protein